MTALALPVGPSRFGGSGWVEFGRYFNGALAITVRAAPTRNSEVECKATVCLDQMGCELGENEVWIKTWSENVGVAEALVAAGVIELTGRAHTFGRNGGEVTALHARLTPIALVELARQMSR